MSFYQHKKVLVTGGTGLIGQPLVEMLVAQGANVTVASLDDVLTGKIWAYMDEARRKSKRQKDLADIARLVERFPQLLSRLPEKLRGEVI